jgi:hypothetical protein
VKAKAKQSLSAFLISVISLASFEASAAVAPYAEEHMEQEASLIVSGKVLSITSKPQKSTHERDLLIARDRIFTITLEVSSVSKGKGAKVGDQMKFQAWQPSTRFPPLPGPQGHQPIPSTGDLVKTYLLYNKKTKTYHPFMPNGINILKEAKDSK